METLSLTSLFSKELDPYQWRVDNVSDDESEREFDDDTTAYDDDDDDDDDDDEVAGTNGEVSNADDYTARDVPDLFDLFG